MSDLERDDIQRLLLSAYGHLRWSANVILRIDDAARARAWLRALVDVITTARHKHDLCATNVAIAYSGLVKLGLDVAAQTFPTAFVDGMASERRARILGDTGKSSPEHWGWGSEPAVDVLLLLFAHEQAVLNELLAEYRAALQNPGLREIETLVCQRHSDGKEHFGFSDGIAQPRIRVEQRYKACPLRKKGTNDVAAGEFILGYTNEYGLQSETPKIDEAADPKGLLSAAGGMRDFGRNGSYLVLRQLEQDVVGFWGFLDAATRGRHGSDVHARERLAAKIVGRWPGGAPLVKAPDQDDPRLSKDNDFGFDADRQGLRCPLGAHIRRANPRDGFVYDRPGQSVQRSNRHRILRRGRPYGPRLKDILVDDGESRGLIFICLNSDIERQFEFMQQTWLNNATFCGLTNEVDPLVGPQPEGAWMTIPREPVRVRLKGLKRFVTTKGGAYFFLPGLRALRYLAALDEGG